MTRKKERERERISKMYGMRRGKKRRKRKPWKDDEKAGRKDRLRERDWRPGDLLRLFPPGAGGTAGPVLADCRLAGSIVTLGGGRAARGQRLKDTGRLGGQKSTQAVRKGGRRGKKEEGD